VTDLEAAWNEVHEARPEWWFVGQPMEFHPGEWHLFAYDPRSARRGVVPHAREWTAIATTEVGCVLELARCFREIVAERWPKSSAAIDVPSRRVTG
jgi:hypothetical protein